MSVEVKTPTKAQFEHKPFPCGAGKMKTGPSPPGFGSGRGGRLNHRQGQPLPGKIGRKRRHSERVQDNRTYGNGFQFKKRYTGHRRDSNIVLPTRFLLGGNINDPLNLESLADDEINQALNENTPVSSPLPTPAFRKQAAVAVLIPPNITDPLNLNCGDNVDVNLLSPKQNRKKRKYKHKRRSVGGAGDTEEGNEGTSDEQIVTKKPDVTRPMHIDIVPDHEQPLSTGESKPTATSDKIRKVVDAIVSPVIPQVSPKTRKRKRTSSGGTESGPSRSNSRDDDTPKSEKSERFTSPTRPKFTRQVSTKAQQQPQQKQQRAKSRDTPSGSGNNQQKQKFIYGNYNRYYGYRNTSQEEDHRLKHFHKEWFEGKDVLDVGCNVGHVTLAIARDFAPRKIIGCDIDGHLIKAAKRNIRHYLSSDLTNTGKFPSSLAVNYGPIAAPPVSRDGDFPTFPHNVAFVQANFVLERDELVELQSEEYDTILGLSLTKWIHLNFGDDGLKRCFKRMFRQLRPGGKLILEPQSWASYKKKKKLTETIHKNFQKIRLKPDIFREYLLSREVGFSTCELLDVPFNKSKGFQRPIQVFTKSETAYPTPFREPTSTCTTPFRGREFDSQGATPRFHIGSETATPSKDSYCSTCASPSNASISPFQGATASSSRFCSQCASPEPNISSPPDAATPPSENRPLSLLRISSAPGKLETLQFSKTLRVNSCPSLLEAACFLAKGQNVTCIRPKLDSANMDHCLLDVPSNPEDVFPNHEPVTATVSEPDRDRVSLDDVKGHSIDKISPRESADAGDAVSEHKVTDSDLCPGPHTLTDSDKHTSPMDTTQSADPVSPLSLPAPSSDSRKHVVQSSDHSSNTPETDITESESVREPASEDTHTSQQMVQNNEVSIDNQNAEAHEAAELAREPSGGQSESCTPMDDSVTVETGDSGVTLDVTVQDAKTEPCNVNKTT